MRPRTLIPAIFTLILLSFPFILLENNGVQDVRSDRYSSDETFSIVVLPDTQIYSRSWPEIYSNMTEWIVDNADDLNIKYVLHEGDITNNNNHPQWYNASKAMYKLNGTAPYTLNPGNHDLGPNGNAANRDTYLNDYFPSDPIQNWTTWGGAYEAGHQENTYHLFSGGGRDWLVVALEMAPRDAVLEWANDIVLLYPDRLTLVVTHNYMVATQRMTTLGGNYGIGNSPEGAATGEDIWQNFVKKHRNIVAVFSGHILYEWGYLESSGIHGNTVYQMMTNFQMNSKGGEGFMRVLTFDMGNNIMDVKTYSPYLDEFNTASEHEFKNRLDIWEYINDEPLILNNISSSVVHEDLEEWFIDLDGNERPGTGIFFDLNVKSGDKLDFDIWYDNDWRWVGLGNPLSLEEFTIEFISNGSFRIYIPENWFGSRDIKIMARDSRGRHIEHSMELIVLPVNAPPILLPPTDWEFS